MAKLPLSHYTPYFANKRWANEKSSVTCYYRDPHQRKVRKQPKGSHQWGRRRGIYTWKIERALNIELENDAALVYEKLCQFAELDIRQRALWAQFLLSQTIRTPTFLRYEKGVRKHHVVGQEPKHDRVGCCECNDLSYITSRDWCYLVAAENDHFIRSDNPVLQTGFIEHPETCLFYPLSPKICFVACSMKGEWRPMEPAETQPPQLFGYELPKGGATMINFHLARAADESLILFPGCDSEFAEVMFSEVLGLYPQPPFMLHSPSVHARDEAYESIRIIMSAIDGCNYPSWQPFELEPFHRKLLHT